MATPTSPSTVTLRITRTYDHPQEAVFRAWTDPKALSRWFAPSDDAKVVVPEFDLRPGGKYRVEMHMGPETHIVNGTYKEITPSTKLVFTWAWDHAPAEETLVTVELKPQGKGTELTLIHERFANTAARDDHQKGWTACLERLTNALAAS